MNEIDWFRLNLPGQLVGVLASSDLMLYCEIHPVNDSCCPIRFPTLEQIEGFLMLVEWFVLSRTFVGNV